MDLYDLTINIPSKNDVFDESVDLMLRTCSYTHTAYPNGNIPMRQITFHKINEETSHRIKNWFLQTFKNHEYNATCTFFLASV